jgi:chromosome partitioning protein
MNKCVRIAFLNSKGGVGKTTSAVNTAAALAECGFEVLLIDMDAQSHVAFHLGLTVDDEQSVDAVLQERRASMDRAIIPSQYERLSVALSTGRLEDVEKLLLLRNQPLDALWQSLKALRGYDFILIDCAPSLGVLSRNAMRASNYLVIPTELDSSSVNGMGRLGTRISELHEDYGDACSQVLGVLVTRFDRRKGPENRASLKQLESAFGDDNDIFFETRIRVDERCNYAKRERRVVLGMSGSRASEDYRALAKEIAKRVGYTLPSAKSTKK